MPTLDWIGKKAVVNHHREVPYHVLRCDPALSVGEPGSGNLLVQGDNLLALKALLPYYAGKVKCIYIDPPYNTGNEGWIYNDNVNSPEIREWLGKVVGKEAEDLSRHDKWLCMMYPRLRVLRDFLREDGAIFVSLDDNEAGSAKLVLDEIFGVRNFVVNMIWQKMDSPSSNAKDRPFSNYHDHTLVYALNAAKCTLRQLPKPEILNAYPEETTDGRRFRLRQLRKNGKAARRKDRPTMWYKLIAPDGTEVWPINPEEGWEGRWALGAKTYAKKAKADLIKWVKRKSGWVPYSVEWAPKEPRIPNPSILTDVGQNRQAKASLNDILGTDHGFDTPKPVGLVKRICEICAEPDSIILDSFSGSGTTGHAVMELNARDGGQRKYVAIELDERICQSITLERLKRLVNGYRSNTTGDPVPGLGGGFRFCRLGPSLLDANGQVAPEIKFDDLARHVWFCETGEPWPVTGKGKRTPLLGSHGDTGIYLLFNGVLGDRTVNGGNVLTASVLAGLPKHKGPKVIYGEASRLGKERLKREGIVFKQIPYEVKGA